MMVHEPKAELLIDTYTFGVPQKNVHSSETHISLMRRPENCYLEAVYSSTTWSLLGPYIRD